MTNEELVTYRERLLAMLIWLTKMHSRQRVQAIIGQARINALRAYLDKLRYDRRACKNSPSRRMSQGEALSALDIEMQSRSAEMQTACKKQAVLEVRVTRLHRQLDKVYDRLAQIENRLARLPQ